MTRNEIFENVESVFRDVLENEDIIIKESYNSNDIDDWDSLNHKILVVEIEKRLNIFFYLQK